MGFLSIFQASIGLAIGFVLGLCLGFYFFIYSHPKIQAFKDPVVRPISELDLTSLQDLVPEIPLWLKNPDYDRVDWLNKFVLSMWPYLDKAICAEIRRTAEPIVADYIGHGHRPIEAITFETLSLGTLPPTFQGIKVFETNENQLMMESAVKWAGNPDIVIVVKIWSLRIKIQPHVDFGLKIQGGDVMSIPGLYQLVQDIIKKEVAKLYLWPQTLEIPILDSSYCAVKKPVGVLHVKVVQATKLMKMDILGLSDPYVKLKLSGEMLPSKKTTIKKKTLNPVWNETFKLVVKDPKAQTLQVNVYDWDKVGSHDRLGMQMVPLKLLQPNETMEFTLDLLKNTNVADPNKKQQRGQIMLEMTYAPFKEDNDVLSGPLTPVNRENDVRFGGGTPSGAGVLLVTVQGAEDIEGVHHNNPYAMATMICIDNSEWMRNGDYSPTRFQAQADVVNLICGAKTQSNPENTVGLLTMAGKGVRVLVTPTSDLGKILACMHGLEIGGEMNLAAGIQVAQLALKHRQNKKQQQRIIVFAGGPVKYDKKVLEMIGKKLKKNSVALDVVNFGEEDESKTEKLEALVAAVNNNDSSHIVHVPAGSNVLSDVLLSTPIFTGDGEGGSGFAAAAAAGGVSGFDFGVDPNLDPELALALRVSMEEERARQEAAAKKAADDSSKQEKEGESTSQDATMSEKVGTSASESEKKKDDMMDDENALLQQALAMSMDDPAASVTTHDTDMVEASADDEDLALALQVSMQEGVKDQSDMGKLLADQSFVSSILTSLPGVDPNDPSVKDLLASMQNQPEKKDDDDKAPKEDDK
ncbi:hypothetical protein SSX86_020500 [Deinandra increscens subsp. villosa]|uniref:26S proteasome non-ATPase regulatory subunit 4 homolog n=1 Tax=Deinandra increscens subsp. villosa TaxID=3103831 RepID=A0AAP0CPE5_9ASTR